MVVSPLTAVLQLVSIVPEGCTWGFMQSPTLEFEDKYEVMAHEDFFFATNGRSSTGVCPCCRGQVLFPLSSMEGGERRTGFVCGTCRYSSAEPLDDACHVWLERFPDVFLQGVVRERRVIKGTINTSDFTALMHSRPADSGAGPDGLTNEMWRAAPKGMQQALLQAVSTVLAGGVITRQMKETL